MGVNWTLLRKRFEIPALGAALGAIVLCADFLGVRHNETTGDAAASEAPVVADAGAAKPDGKKKKGADEEADKAPTPVRVPSSASGARSSGNGGSTWMGGDVATLGAEFRRSVSSQFGNTSLGQAQLGMAGLGFQCAIGAGGKMSCEKVLEAGGCTLTWSVSMQTRGGQVGEAGGQGFSRECGT